MAMGFCLVGIQEENLGKTFLFFPRWDNMGVVVNIKSVKKCAFCKQTIKGFLCVVKTKYMGDMAPTEYKSRRCDVTQTT